MNRRPGLNPFLAGNFAFWAIVLRGCVGVLLLCVAASAQDFALQAGAHKPDAKVLAPPTGNRLITLAQMRLPGVEGTTLRTRKHWPESFLANCVVTVHKAGDQWTWLPCGGDERDPLTPASLTAREKLYRDGAAKYASDPSLYAVHAFVAPAKPASGNAHSEECFFGRPMPKAAKDAQKRIISHCAALFPRQRIIWTGSAQDPAANIEIIKHGVKVAPGRFIYKMNAMSPKNNYAWAGTTLLVDAAKLGADIGFEMLQPSNHPKFGGTWDQFTAKVKEVERRAGKAFAYRAYYPHDITKLGKQEK